MALITLAEYARRHGRNPATLRQNVSRFKTVCKVGNTWLIDEDEPFPADRRIKSGRFIGQHPQRLARANRDD